MLQEGNDFVGLLGTSIFLMRAGQIGLPSVDLGLELILLFIGFENDSVLIDHSGFSSEKGLNVLAVEVVESIGIELDGSVLFLFGLLDLELFLFHLLGFTLLLLALLLRLLLFDLFLLRHLGLLKPFFHQLTLLESDQSVLSVSDLESNTEDFCVGVLWLGDEISDVFAEAINCWLVFNQNFNCLLAGELDGLASRHLSSNLVNVFALLLRVLAGI